MINPTILKSNKNVLMKIMYAEIISLKMFIQNFFKIN